MSRTKASKSAAKPNPRDPERTARLWRISINLTLIALFVGGGGIGLYCVRKYVDTEVAAQHGGLQIVLKNRPGWMTDFLADEIAASARPTGTYSTFDRELLVRVRESLEANPWIAQVKQVRRAYSQAPGDTLELDCEYRVPVALVKWGDYFWLVDGEGFKLPEQFSAGDAPRIVTGPDHHVNIRVIDGVRRPPPEAGRKWPGDDLAAGLAMVKLLFDKPFAEEIITVSVSNYAGRLDANEAHLVLLTRHKTEIRWGRPPGDKDSFEIADVQKLAALQRVAAQYGRVDARQPWIDIRFDKITYPTPSPAAAEAAGRP